MTKIVRPSPGWLRLLWSEHAQPAPHLVEAIRAAAEVPGCRLSPLCFDAPWTTWMLPEVGEVFGFTEPPATLPHDDSWMPARPLYEHQKVGAAWLVERCGGLLADDMGLGKTIQAIVAAHRIRLELDLRRPGVIVGPLYTRAVWRQELLASGAIVDPKQFCALVSEDLNDGSFDAQAPWFFVHYDVARFWWSRLQHLRPAVAIVDEAHWVKNGRAKRSKAAGMIALPTPNRIVLTGTPVEESPANLWWLLTLAGGPRTWGGPLDFRKRYCGAVPTGYGGHEDLGPTHQEELQLRLSQTMLRRTVAQAGLHMPALTRSFVDAPLTNADRYASEQSQVDVRQLVAAIQTGAVAEVLPIYNRLRVLTSAGKIAATVEHVSSALDQGQAVVVFCWARETARGIFDQLGSRTERYVVTGEDPQERRDYFVREFQSRIGPAVLVATYGALREGVTLHRARIVVLHDLELTVGAMRQAEKRIHRIGQLSACQSLWMVALGSVDTLVAPILARKAEVQEGVLGEAVGLEALNTTSPADVDAAMAAWEATLWPSSHDS